MATSAFELPADGLLAAQLCLAQRLPAGDPYRIRAAARRCGAYAAELRRSATMLLSSADSDLWRGSAHQALAAKLRSKAPRLSASADRYEQYASALASYAWALDETSPRLLSARSQLVQHSAVLGRPGVPPGSESARPQPAAGLSAWGLPSSGLPSSGLAASDRLAAGAVDQRQELLPYARQFKTSYDQWASALDRCTRALLRANDSDPTRDPHGISALGHTLKRASKYLTPVEYALLHPSLRSISDCLAVLNTELSLLGLALLFVCPPAGAACFAVAAVLSLAQLAIDAHRRANGEHVSGTALGLEATGAIPMGGSAFRGLRAAEEVVHLVPGGGLMAHEAAGGHTLAKHVGKTVEFLQSRLAAEPGIKAASTFYDRESAEGSLSDLINVRAPEIVRWLSGVETDVVLKGRARRPVGFVISNKMGRTDATGIRLVLRRSSIMPAGFRIHTAMVTL